MAVAMIIVIIFLVAILGTCLYIATGITIALPTIINQIKDLTNMLQGVINEQTRDSKSDDQEGR